MGADQSWTLWIHVDLVNNPRRLEIIWTICVKIRGSIDNPGTWHSLNYPESSCAHMDGPEYCDSMWTLHTTQGDWRSSGLYLRSFMFLSFRNKKKMLIYWYSEEIVCQVFRPSHTIWTHPLFLVIVMEAWSSIFVSCSKGEIVMWFELAHPNVSFKISILPLDCWQSGKTTLCGPFRASTLTK